MRTWLADIKLFSASNPTGFRIRKIIFLFEEFWWKLKRKMCKRGNNVVWTFQCFMTRHRFTQLTYRWSCHYSMNAFLPHINQFASSLHMQRQINRILARYSAWNFKTALCNHNLLQPLECDCKQFVDCYNDIHLNARYSKHFSSNRFKIFFSSRQLCASQPSQIIMLTDLLFCGTLINNSNGKRNSVLYRAVQARAQCSIESNACGHVSGASFSHKI